MKTVYKIEISLLPNNNYPTKQYSWTIWSNQGMQWCNNNSGWAKSPEEAWNNAYKFYLSYIKSTK